MLEREIVRNAAAGFSRGPVVLMDVGDNMGGGSPGDSTVLLEAAQRLGVRRYHQTLCDRDTVRACVAAGVGRTLTLDVGAKRDDRHGRPVSVTGVCATSPTVLLRIPVHDQTLVSLRVQRGD